MKKIKRFFFSGHSAYFSFNGLSDITKLSCWSILTLDRILKFGEFSFFLNFTIFASFKMFVRIL